MANPHKVFYKGTENDFIVFVEDSEALKKYRSNDKTVPLVDVISIYKVYTNRQGGNEGVIDEASNSELQNEFGTRNIDEVLLKIIREGSDKLNPELQHGKSPHNDSKGPAYIGH